jgi:hypothetical protein
MKLKEVLARVTGFSVPVFGVSWNPPQLEVASARRVLAYLEDRRVLYNPYHLEVAWECVQSVLDIRRFLTEAIGGLGADSKLANHLRAMRAACRAFLNATSYGDGRHGPARQHWMGPYESAFFTALGELRAAIGLHVAAIAIMHGLDVEGDLATILPAAIEKENENRQH